MNKQQLAAAGILLVVIAWVTIPRSADSTATESDTGPAAAEVRVVSADQVLDSESGFVVRAARLTAETFVESIRVRGQTEASRMVSVRAEQTGRVVNTPLEPGSRVGAGDLLCEIAVDSRQVELQEAESREAQARLELDASVDLNRQNLLSEVSVAQARSAHDSALAAVERARLALANTRIRAPFDGILEERPAEIGDLLERGGICATVLDDSPMLAVGLVAENDIARIASGAPVEARLVTGERLTGRVSFISAAADEQFRSYRLEAELDAPAASLRAGITAEILVSTTQLAAHRIPASALTLNDAGVVGVKTLDALGVVQFVPVNIVGDDPALDSASLWVSGLPTEVTLITHGQEIVFAGQRVQADFNWSETPR